MFKFFYRFPQLRRANLYRLILVLCHLCRFLCLVGYVLVLVQLWLLDVWCTRLFIFLRSLYAWLLTRIGWPIPSVLILFIWSLVYSLYVIWNQGQNYLKGRGGVSFIYLNNGQQKVSLAVLQEDSICLLLVFRLVPY